MKSLRESLFDKDLVKKDLKFRDAYDLLIRGIDDPLAGCTGTRAWGMPIGQMFSSKKIEKYKTPYYPDILNKFFAGLLGVITDMPIPDKRDFNKGMYCDWCQKLMSKQYLGKYVLPSWKLEYDRKFEVGLKNRVSNNSSLISLELRDGDNGGYIFTFKEKNS